MIDFLNSSFTPIFHLQLKQFIKSSIDFLKYNSHLKSLSSNSISKYVNLNFSTELTMHCTKLLALHCRIVNVVSRRGYKLPTCEPSPRPINVTITGANSPVGQTVALLLKQFCLIDEVRLFDYKDGPCGTALDLSHIDTNTKVKAYTGLHMLRPAIEGAKVVVVCGGDAVKPSHPEYELFVKNADYVRNVAIHTAEFNPKTVLCIATPPITAMVPLVSEEYKKARVYDSRKIIGVTALTVMRANSILGEFVKKDSSNIMCPIVGGMSDKTTVAVLSQTEAGAKLEIPVADVVRNKVARAENDVLNLKYIENSGPCIVSTAFATARFINSVVRGLLDMFDGFECAFVRQTGETANFLQYMGSVVKLGKYGIQSIHMPKLDNFECVHLQRAAQVIEEQIAWGEGYITGVAHKKKRRCIRSAPFCHTLKVQHISRVGDVAFNKDSEEAEKQGKLVPVTR